MGKIIVNNTDYSTGGSDANMFSTTVGIALMDFVWSLISVVVVLHDLVVYLLHGQQLVYGGV